MHAVREACGAGDMNEQGQYEGRAEAGMKLITKGLEEGLMSSRFRPTAFSQASPNRGPYQIPPSMKPMTVTTKMAR